ncbi:hypothetical protein [Lichenihabitans psoromatis]|uniref:hypothetical protein n=1 Tax=Lichenihabitans psoromatis TaxID=2528642 RepID=UPI00103689BA|nr:hypothetical protein [Lichenihabitans psoromatis]
MPSSSPASRTRVAVSYDPVQSGLPMSDYPRVVAETLFDRCSDLIDLAEKADLKVMACLLHMARVEAELLRHKAKAAERLVACTSNATQHVIA